MAIKGGYTLNHNPAFIGQIADGQLSNAVSKVNTSPDNIKFGYGVVAVDDDGIKLPETTSTAKDFVGVVIRELNRAYVKSDGSDFGAVSDMECSVMTTGVIWVQVSESVTARDDACLGVAVGNKGTFGKTPAASSMIAITGAKFLTSAENGELAKLSLVIGG